MVIYADEQRLDWSDEEVEMLADVKPDVTGLLPGGVHFRPYGPDSLLLLWEFFHHDMEVCSPLLDYWRKCVVQSPYNCTLLRNGQASSYEDQLHGLCLVAQVTERCPSYDITFRTETYPEICVCGLRRAIPGFADYEVWRCMSVIGWQVWP